MFTGIIEEIGRVERIESLGGGIRLTVHGPRTVVDLRKGDSVSINGVCQTVIMHDQQTFTVEVVEETLSKTTMSEFRRGRCVNLERALRLGDRMGGHIVQGHVDGVGVIRSIRPQQTSSLVDIEVPTPLTRYVVPIGSIAIDGISFTVAALEGLLLTVAVIPHTMEQTTFRDASDGTRVNLECDLIGKYIESLSAGRTQGSESTITKAKLENWGYGDKT